MPQSYGLQKLLELDARHSQRLTVADKPGLLRSMAVFLAHSGDSWLWLAGLAVVWGFGSEFWKMRALVLGLSILATAVLVLLIKFSVRRQRPQGTWGRIYRSTDPHSFPSGHAARAFLLAVTSLGLGPGWLGWALAAWAPLVPLARVMMGVHYLSDVLAGALIGIAMGGLVLALVL